MELNGLANLTMLVSALEQMEFSNQEEADFLKKTVERMCTELDTLNRYMVAVGEAIEDTAAQDKVPFWHEVREAKDKYPTLREKMEGRKA